MAKRQKRRNRWRARVWRSNQLMWQQLGKSLEYLAVEQQRREEAEKHYQEIMAEIGDSLNSVAYAVGSSPSAMRNAIRAILAL